MPGILDPGSFLFLSEVFVESFPHRFELTTVLRQDTGEASFKSALAETRLGDCSAVTEEYLSTLSRALPEDSKPVHLYFKRLPVQLHNFNSLCELDGELIQLQSIDSGYSRPLEKTVDRLIHLKDGCEIMLLSNVNRQLRMV